MLQGPFANVNVFLALESSSADLPEHISHASPKIMPFAFAGVQAEAEPGVPAARRESSEPAVRAAGAAERGVKRCPSEPLLPAGSWAEWDGRVRMGSPWCLGFGSGSWITGSLEARQASALPL